MRLSYTIALGASAFAATPALAQEPGPFTGAHVEAMVGYDHLSGGDDGTDDSTDGLYYGVMGGYDFQFGQLIAGIEGEVSDSTAKVRGTDVNLVGDNLRINADRDLYIGARLGYAIAPTTMLYVKGGYTNLRVKSRFDNGTGGLFEEGVTLDGWRAGAGIEQKFNFFGPGGFIKAEYRYSNYTNLDLANVDQDVNLDRHQVVAGIGIRF